MEVFGIVLSILAAAIASAVYVLFLKRIVIKSHRVSRVFLGGSYLIFIGICIELLLLIALGAVKSRGVIGPAFYWAHLLFFFGGPPAVANFFVLRSPERSKGYIPVVLACTITAFILVLLQYSVSEALFGIDGTGGPYHW